MSKPDFAPEADLLAALPQLPCVAGKPVFAEAWEARAFALAVHLSKQGHFTWPEWVTELSDELTAAASRGETDDASRYYHHWLTALERLVTARGLVGATELFARKEAMAEAYQR